jgi:mono/diheme cytochrome c family protein
VTTAVAPRRLPFVKRGMRVTAVGLAALMSLALHPAFATGVSRAQIERGRYLATAGDCIACHTRKGGTPFVGGLPIETPFGTIYSPNLTPDSETGLGRWTNDDFYRALHEGVAADGSRLYPAFPYAYYTHLTRDDADAIKAYLDTLPPKRYRPPKNSLPFPLNQRVLLRAWNLLFFTPSGLLGIRSPRPGLEHGRYLVEALGHCGACHTPKNLLGADQNSDHLGGGEIQAWVACNLTADARSGLSAWNEDEIVEYLKTGRNVHALATGPMRDVVEYSTSQLTDDDLQAMAAYLKTLPAGGHDTNGTTPTLATHIAGEAIFLDECSACHRSNGQALPRAFSPLKGSASVQAQNPTSVIRVILEGARVATTDRVPTPFAMPAFDWKLNDQEVADVATYVRNAWGNAAPPVDAAAVARLRKKLATNMSVDVAL